MSYYIRLFPNDILRGLFKDTWPIWVRTRWSGSDCTGLTDDWEELFLQTGRMALRLKESEYTRREPPVGARVLSPRRVPGILVQRQEPLVEWPVCAVTQPSSLFRCPPSGVQICCLGDGKSGHDTALGTGLPWDVQGRVRLATCVVWRLGVLAKFAKSDSGLRISGQWLMCLFNAW